MAGRGVSRPQGPRRGTDRGRPRHDKPGSGVRERSGTGRLLPGPFLRKKRRKKRTNAEMTPRLAALVAARPRRPQAANPQPTGWARQARRCAARDRQGDGDGRCGRAVAHRRWPAPSRWVGKTSHKEAGAASPTKRSGRTRRSGRKPPDKGVRKPASRQMRPPAAHKHTPATKQPRGGHDLQQEEGCPPNYSLKCTLAKAPLQLHR